MRNRQVVGGTPVVDTALDTQSTDVVQNKVVAEAISTINSTFTNFFKSATIKNGYTTNVSGAEVAVSDFKIIYLPVDNGTKYIVSNIGYASKQLRIHAYNGNTWVRQLYESTGVVNNFEFTATDFDNIKISTYQDGTNDRTSIFVDTDLIASVFSNLITLDYTNKVPIANQNMPSGSFTAPRNGVALCNLQINITGYINVLVNGVFVATTSIVGGQVTPVLMKKGDVMTWNSNNEQNYMRCDGATRSIFI